MKPEDFWKNITDEQFDAAVKKFGFSELDLHDIRKARFIICQLAHGDLPIERSTVDVTCDNERCVSPKHLKWAPIRSIDAVVADLDALTEATENASNLLYDLKLFRHSKSVLADALETYKPDALTPRRSKEVPTFGGQRPADDVGVISWDEHRLLVSNGSGWEIIDRAKWAGLSPRPGRWSKVGRSAVRGSCRRDRYVPLQPRSIKHSSIQAFRHSSHPTAEPVPAVKPPERSRTLRPWNGVGAARRTERPVGANPATRPDCQTVGPEAGARPPLMPTSFSGPQHISFGKRLFSLAASNFAKVISQIDLSTEDFPSILFNRSIHLSQSCRRYSQRHYVAQPHCNVPRLHRNAFWRKLGPESRVVQKLCNFFQISGLIMAKHYRHKNIVRR